jgi:hypothetical protein
MLCFKNAFSCSSLNSKENIQTQFLGKQKLLLLSSFIPCLSRQQISKAHSGHNLMKLALGKRRVENQSGKVKVWLS